MGYRSRSRSRSRTPARRPMGYQGGMKGGPCATIFVASVDFDTRERDIQQLFEDNGFDVKSVSIPHDRETNRPKGFAFVDLKDAEDLDDAVRKVNGAELHGKTLKCEPRMPRINDRRSRSGGRGRGGNGGGRRDSRRRGGGGGRRDSRRRDSRRR